MLKIKTTENRLITVIAVFIMFLLFLKVDAYVMGSNNYQIVSDSINFGGGESVSSNYNLNDTLGEIATGHSESASYKMRAGFWQMQAPYISINVAPDIFLADISGLVGGESVESTDWIVLTDNEAGYSLSIKSLTSPALKSSVGFIEDYVPETSNPDYEFILLTENDSRFGFTAEGEDIVSAFKDDFPYCGSGINYTPNKCWDGFSTTDKIVSLRNASNHPEGSTTTIRYKAKIGSSKIQESGVYTAEITITAVTL